MYAKLSTEAVTNDGIHVIENCYGYTKGARTELYALRPLLVQVSFMGFLVTLGAQYMEQHITDVVTAMNRIKGERGNGGYVFEWIN